MEAENDWLALVHNTRDTADFTYWTNHDSYEKAFEQLLHVLKGNDKGTEN